MLKWKFTAVVFMANTLCLVYWMINNLHHPETRALSSDLLVTQFYHGSGNISGSATTELLDELLYTETAVPWRVNTFANCKQLFLGNETEIQQTLAVNANISSEVYYNETELLKQTSNCNWLREQFSDSHFHVSNFERQFPLAFTFVIHDNAHQILRLVQQLYRSHNSFCFHYDAKSSDTFKEVFNNMANCLDNVIVPSKIESITWGTHSILEAQINCIHDLRRYREWKYVITLCGKELPILTNREMVNILKKQNGKAVVNPTKVYESSDIMKRLKWQSTVNSNGRVAFSSEPLGPIPFNLTVYKNMAYMALSQPFVHYILHNETADGLRQFLAKCSNPEEHFYSMLYMQDGIPGGHDFSKASSVRISGTTWIAHEDIDTQLENGEQVLKHPVDRCQGKVVHRVCILNSADLQMLQSVISHKLTFFYNKYFMEVDTTVMQCLEESIELRNQQERLRYHKTKAERS